MDVAVQRYQTLSGKQAALDGDDRLTYAVASKWIGYPLMYSFDQNGGWLADRRQILPLKFWESVRRSISAAAYLVIVQIFPVSSPRLKTILSAATPISNCP